MPAYTPNQLAAVLLASGVSIVAETRKVVQKGSQNIKNEGRRNSIVSSGRSAAGAPYAIEYETRFAKTKVEGEVSYGDKNKMGKLGALLEFGGGRDHSPPHRDLARALEAEEPRFVQALEDLPGRLLNR